MKYIFLFRFRIVLYYMHMLQKLIKFQSVSYCYSNTFTSEFFVKKNNTNIYHKTLMKIKNGFKWSEFFAKNLSGIKKCIMYCKMLLKSRYNLYTELNCEIRWNIWKLICVNNLFSEKLDFSHFSFVTRSL